MSTFTKYNAKKAIFEPVNFKVQQEYINPNGSTTKTFNIIQDFQESINTRLSKNGDSMHGDIVFTPAFGILGKSYAGQYFFSSKLEYTKEADNTANHGYFKITNTKKNIADTNSEESNSFNLICDSTLTEDSNNLVTSGTLYTIINGLEQRISNLENQ